MKRRGFLKNLCKVVAVSTVVPTVLTSITETLTVPFEAGSKIIEFEVKKCKFWMDYKTYIEMQNFYTEQERKLSYYMCNPCNKEKYI